MEAVTQRVILDDELGSERGARIERHGSGAVELLVGQTTNRGGGLLGIVAQQLERLLLADPDVVSSVSGIHRRDIGPGHSGDRIAVLSSIRAHRIGRVRRELRTGLAGREP